MNWEKKTDYVTLKEVISTEQSVVTGVELWNNILNTVEPKIMVNIQAVSNTYKQNYGDTATVSLKKEWKPTFSWNRDELILDPVPKEDVVTRDS